jgi:hypothetical protein
MSKHKIETLRAKVARLEAEIAHDIYVELAVLPKQFGFDSVPDFVAAVKQAARDAAPEESEPAAQPRRRRKAKASRTKAGAPKRAAAPAVPDPQVPVETMIPPG